MRAPWPCRCSCAQPPPPWWFEPLLLQRDRSTSSDSADSCSFRVRTWQVYSKSTALSSVSSG